MSLPGFLQLEDLPQQHNEMHRKLFQFTLAVLPKTFTTAPTTDELPPGYVAYYKSGNEIRLYINVFGNIINLASNCVLGFASSGGVGIAAGTTKYSALLGGAFGTTNWHSTEANRQHIMPFAGVAKNLYIRTTGAQPAAGNLVLTVRKNGVATALTITVAASEAAGTKTNLSNEVTFAAGDLITLQGVNNDAGSTSALINQRSLEYEKI